MKSSFFLKLTIGIVVVFGLLLTGYYLSEPLWWKYYELKLGSADAATREAAARTVAAKGKQAIPHLKKWAESNIDARIINACQVLARMAGETWRDALPELEKILDCDPSIKTDAAAKVLVCNNFPWRTQYKEYPTRLVNMHCYIIQYSPSMSARKSAALALEVMGDPRAVMPLSKALENDSNSHVRLACTQALGQIGGPQAVESLIKVLAVEDPAKVTRWGAAMALGEIRDKRAVEPLINALKNEPNANPYFLGQAAAALGKLGDRRAVDQLLDTLKNAHGITGGSAATALGLIGDLRAVEPLIEALLDDSNRDDPNADVRPFAACGILLMSETVFREKIDSALRQAGERGNKVAIVGLGWLNGGDDLQTARKVVLGHCGIFDSIIDDAEVRWGNASRLFNAFNAFLCPYAPFHKDILFRMPESFPKFDFKAKYATREKQLRKIKAWYNKNKHHLAWDADKRKYLLKSISAK